MSAELMRERRKSIMTAAKREWFNAVHEWLRSSDEVFLVRSNFKYDESFIVPYDSAFPRHDLYGFDNFQITYDGKRFMLTFNESGRDLRLHRYDESEDCYGPAEFNLEVGSFSWLMNVKPKQKG